MRNQKALQDAGFENETNGRFGEWSELAEKGFQARFGVAVDGKPGFATWGKLVSPEASVPGATSGGWYRAAPLWQGLSKRDVPKPNA